MKSHKRFSVYFVLVACGLAAVGILGTILTKNRNAVQSLEPNDSGRMISESISEKRFDWSNSRIQEAKEWLSSNHGINDPSELDVLMAAGGLAMEKQEYEYAIECFRQVPTDHVRFGLTARFEQAMSFLNLNRAQAAEDALREYLAYARKAPLVEPAQVADAFKWLTYLLSVQLRLEEREPLLREQHEIGLADPLDSKQLYFPNLLLLNSPRGRTRLQQFIEEDSSNLSLQIALLHYKVLSGEFEAAINGLRELLKKSNENLVILGVLAEAYFESDRTEEFMQLLRGLPEYHPTEPRLLTRMRGELALLEDRWQEAADFFSSVLDAEPSNSPSQMGLAMAYQEMGQSEKHRTALQRASVLAKIRVNLGNVQSDAEAACLELAQHCRDIGMVDAAAIFDNHAERIRETEKQRSQHDR